MTRWIPYVALLCLPVYAAPEPSTVWISADPPLAAPGSEITVEVHEGAPFGDSARSVRRADGDRLQRLWKQGRSNVGGSEARFVAEGAGVQLIVYDAPGHDRFAKALIVVGAPRAGDPLRWSEVGQTLEIVPQSDPVSLSRGGGELEVQVLFDREPLADAVVEAIRDDAPGSPQRARTDEIGIARVKLDRPGRWLVRTEHRGACGSCDDGSVRGFGASLALAVASGGGT